MTKRRTTRFVIKSTPQTPSVYPNGHHAWAGQVPRRDAFQSQILDGLPGRGQQQPWTSDTRTAMSHNPAPMPTGREWSAPRPYVRTSQVVEGLNLSPSTQGQWTSFLDDNLQQPEIAYRAAVVRKTRDLPPDVRRVVADRALSLYRTRGMVRKAIDDGASLTELAKALPRGGRYHRRTPNGKGGWKYHYDPEKYADRDDAHLSGADTLVRNLTRKWSEAGRVPGETVDKARAKHGNDVVEQALQALGYSMQDCGHYSNRADDEADTAVQNGATKHQGEIGKGDNAVQAAARVPHQERANIQQRSEVPVLKSLFTAWADRIANGDMSVDRTGGSASRRTMELADSILRRYGPPTDADRAQFIRLLKPVDKRVDQQMAKAESMHQLRTLLKDMSPQGGGFGGGAGGPGSRGGHVIGTAPDGRPIYQSAGQPGQLSGTTQPPGQTSTPQPRLPLQRPAQQPPQQQPMQQQQPVARPSVPPQQQLATQQPVQARAPMPPPQPMAPGGQPQQPVQPMAQPQAQQQPGAQPQQPQETLEQRAQKHGVPMERLTHQNPTIRDSAMRTLETKERTAAARAQQPVQPGAAVAAQGQQNLKQVQQHGRQTHRILANAGLVKGEEMAGQYGDRVQDGSVEGQDLSVEQIGRTGDAKVMGRRTKTKQPPSEGNPADADSIDSQQLDADGEGDHNTSIVPPGPNGEAIMVRMQSPALYSGGAGDLDQWISNALGTSDVDRQYKRPGEDDLDDGIEKAGTGEGSRGGHVVGHTPSGKPIYQAQVQSIPGLKGNMEDLARHQEHKKTLAAGGHVPNLTKEGNEAQIKDIGRAIDNQISNHEAEHKPMYAEPHGHKHLQELGQTPGIRAGDLKPGTKLAWNQQYGQTAVDSVKPHGKHSVKLTERDLKTGQTYTRTKRKDSLIGVTRDHFANGGKRSTMTVKPTGHEAAAHDADRKNLVAKEASRTADYHTRSSGGFGGSSDTTAAEAHEEAAKLHGELGNTKSAERHTEQAKRHRERADAAKARNSAGYDAAHQTARDASKEFNQASADYRARKIGDEEYLAARKKHEAASSAFDQAHSKEQASQTKGEKAARSAYAASKAAYKNKTADRAEAHEKAASKFAEAAHHLGASASPALQQHARDHAQQAAYHHGKTAEALIAAHHNRTGDRGTPLTPQMHAAAQHHIDKMHELGAKHGVETTTASNLHRDLHDPKGYAERNYGPGKRGAAPKSADEHQGDAMESFIARKAALSELVDLLNKADAGGEGSRGGHVVGHSASGKPIYQSSGMSAEKEAATIEAGKNAAEHASYKTRTVQKQGGDVARAHEEAAHLHQRVGEVTGDESHMERARGHAEQAAEHRMGSAEKLMDQHRDKPMPKAVHAQVQQHLDNAKISAGQHQLNHVHGRVNALQARLGQHEVEKSLTKEQQMDPMNAWLAKAGKTKKSDGKALDADHIDHERVAPMGDEEDDIQGDVSKADTDVERDFTDRDAQPTYRVSENRQLTKEADQQDGGGDLVEDDDIEDEFDDNPANNRTGLGTGDAGSGGKLGADYTGHIDHQRQSVAGGSAIGAPSAERDDELKNDQEDATAAMDEPEGSEELEKSQMVQHASGPTLILTGLMAAQSELQANRLRAKAVRAKQLAKANPKADDDLDGGVDDKEEAELGEQGDYTSDAKTSKKVAKAKTREMDGMVGDSEPDAMGEDSDVEKACKSCGEQGDLCKCMEKSEPHRMHIRGMPVATIIDDNADRRIAKSIDQLSNRPGRDLDTRPLHRARTADVQHAAPNGAWQLPRRQR